ncbi:MAG: response regulator transcription factor [Myxococcota bacterium]
MTAKIRLILADDHQIVLDGLELLLAQKYEVVARVTNGSALFDEVQKHRPEVVVSDVRMPEEDGLSAARRILAVLPKTRVVLVTMDDDPAIASAAIKAGAHGYVLKSEASRELFTAIETVVSGETYISPALSSARPDPAKAPDPKIPANLTERQVEVLRQLGQGLTMKEVAAKIHISPRTVAFHKYRIMEQLGVQTNAELIRYALSLGDDDEKN